MGKGEEQTAARKRAPEAPSKPSKAKYNRNVSDAKHLGKYNTHHSNPGKANQIHLSASLVAPWYPPYPPFGSERAISPFAVRRQGQKRPNWEMTPAMGASAKFPACLELKAGSLGFERHRNPTPDFP